jgi:hypothetical protein
MLAIEGARTPGQGRLFGGDGVLGFAAWYLWRAAERATK